MPHSLQEGDVNGYPDKSYCMGTAIGTVSSMAGKEAGECP
jgi:hypothetical protein